jgi:hypothetical protein
MDIYVNAAAPNDRRKAHDFTENWHHPASGRCHSVFRVRADKSATVFM